MTSTFAELAADRPLDDPAADTLGRNGFAEHVAAELLARQGREHLVIGLNGDMGSGKTTLKNFIRHHLRAAAAHGPAPAIVEFNPWLGRDRRDPGQALHVQMAEQLAAQSAIPGAAELGATWRRLAGGSDAADTGADGASGTRQTRDALPAQLRALPGPVVLFIDDLDQLPSAEVAQVCRALKANGDLPNIVCFLLFAREAMVRALDAETPGRGAESLRQFVQIELELPAAPEALLRQQLESGLATLLDRVTFPVSSRDRWQNVIAGGVWPLFSTPRDVKRFLSAFGFQFARHFDDAQRVLEVNPIDLVVLEAVRMFAHPVYQELRDTVGRREARLVRLLSGRDDERKEARLEFDELVERLPLAPRERRAVAAALQNLLPPGTGGVHGVREDWDRDLRLCSPRHSARYFHLGAVADALPARRLLEIVRTAGDRLKLEALLLGAATEDVLPEVLERIPPLLGTLTEADAAVAAAALAGICDRIPAGAPDDIETRLIRLAGELFARLQNPLKRETVVAELLDDGTRLTGPILLLYQLRPRSDLPAGTASTCVSIEQFRRLIKPALERLQASAADGSIWRSREYGALIKRWWEWSTNRDEIRRWLLEEMKQPERARAWLRAFLAPSPTAAREMVFQLEELGQYCDPAAVATAAAKAEGDGIDRAAVRTVAQALSPRGTSAGFALRTLVVKLDGEGG